MDTTKIFNNGNSQAVRLPKEYRFQEKEVGIRKIGGAVLLFPIDRAWDTFLDGINGFSDDFLSEGRQCQPEQTRESL